MIFRLEFELMDGRLRYRIADGASHFAEPEEALRLSMMNGRWTIDVTPKAMEATPDDHH